MGLSTNRPTCNDQGMQFLFRTIGNMAGIWVTTLMMTAIHFRTSESGLTTVLFLFFIAAILTSVNYALRPLLKVLTFPLYLVTLGLFTVVMNGLMFGATSWISHLFRVPLVVDGNWSAILGGTITAIVSSLVTNLLGKMFNTKQTI